MKGIFIILTNLRAAIAVVAARDRALTALLVLVWTRISRIGARLERLMAQWRAGTLPKPRAPRSPGIGRASPTVPRPSYPTTPAWLLTYVREAAACRSQMAHLMAQPDFAAFLEEVPQARRILRPICRMLGVGVAVPRAWKPRRQWTVHPPGTSAPAPAGLVLGPGGRLIYV